MGGGGGGGGLYKQIQSWSLLTLKYQMFLICHCKLCGKYQAPVETPYRDRNRQFNRSDERYFLMTVPVSRDSLNSHFQPPTHPKTTTTKTKKPDLVLVVLLNGLSVVGASFFSCLPPIDTTSAFTYWVRPRIPFRCRSNSIEDFCIPLCLYASIGRQIHN